ncbi:MAG: kelch repeat-containing protein, partial [Terriglobia bacterium]
MREHFKLTLAVPVNLVLLTGPMLTLASSHQKQSLPKQINAVASGSLGNRESNKPLKLPVPINSPASKLDISPEGQTITLLPDGRTLLIGGQRGDGPQSTVAIRDPRTAETLPLQNRLQYARAWHTATLQPDGTVLILGGLGLDGRIAETAELFDPETQRFETLIATRLTARAYHTASLLTEGQVLIVGGMSSEGRLERKAELYDPQTRTARILKATVKTARYGHSATLLANGRVLLRGGADKNGKAIEDDETYDSASQRFTRNNTEINPQSELANPQLEASLP